jgi:hypothetical protein
MFWLEISFENSSSANHGKAAFRAKKIPTYYNDGNRHEMEFDRVSLCKEYIHQVRGVASLASKWNTFLAKYNGNIITEYQLNALLHEISKRTF